MSAKSQEIRISEHLPKRQRQVLELLADGETTKGIGMALGLSPKAVEWHRISLMRRVGAV